MSSPAKMFKSDARLDFVSMPNWNKEGTRQPLQGSEIVAIDPVQKVKGTESHPLQLDFELSSKKCILMGPYTRFKIKGGFEVSTKDPDTLAYGPYLSASADEIAKVCLCPNWFEQLIKSIDVFHQNTRIVTSNEGRFISPWVNCLLYNLMDPLAKKVLCPDPEHSAYCVPKKKDSWGIADEDYQNYAKNVFIGKSFAFEHIPLFGWPFHQSPNHLMNNELPSILPMPLLDKLNIRITFFDSQAHIFRNIATNNSKYRFAFDEFKLVVEEADLSPAYERSFLSQKRLLPYPGVTRLQLVEPIPGGTPTYRTKFQQISMPESLLIFCLKKDVASGTFSFGSTVGKNVFEPHKIESLDFSFDGKRFFLRDPNLGNFKHDLFDRKALLDHLYHPVMGIMPDAANFTKAQFEDGGIKSAYSHIYISLLNFGSERSRIIPSLDDGSCLNKKADFEIFFKFPELGSPDDVVYVVYAIYTDVSTVFDMKTKTLSSAYIPFMN